VGAPTPPVSAGVGAFVIPGVALVAAGAGIGARELRPRRRRKARR
jgi:hypothetical protein